MKIMIKKPYSFLDQICLQVDHALRVVHGIYPTTTQRDPTATIPEPTLSTEQKKHAAALMRVNHVGEICAQALYQGQAFTSRNEQIKQDMQHAAHQELEHLVWCSQRLKELYSHESYLNPLWYVGAFSLGALAGVLNDAWSLGFVVETERQVEKHLADHLEALPKDDLKSRAIVAQMKIDEAAHADAALAAGGKILPHWVQTIMRFQAKIMTTTAYWV
jgi:ubiquinone biosynthesis monooxygenase Coq7